MLIHIPGYGGDLDYMDVASLMATTMTPWKLTENPAMKFPKDG